MKIALAIYRMKPRGGIEDQCVRLGQELLRRGHRVTVLTTQADENAGLPFRILDIGNWRRSNHSRMAGFASAVARHVAADPVDRLVTFQPLPGADIYFSGDRMRYRMEVSRLRRWTPRFRTYARLEEACFSPRSKTRVIGLGRPQIQEYAEHYQTPPERIRLLPPSIDSSLRRPEHRTTATRQACKQSLGLAAAQDAWLWLGLQPRIKGLDRAIRALAHFSDAVLLVGGLAETDNKARPFVHLARKSGVADRIKWLGYLGRPALMDAMAAADLLVHPARTEVTGGVILEALINGLPVVTTANCGFAEHVRTSGAGCVISVPFDDRKFIETIRWASGNETLSAKGIAYGAAAPLYHGLSVAADLVEMPAEGWNVDKQSR